jgi:3-hydroxypropanoate dehydrogenase
MNAPELLPAAETGRASDHSLDLMFRDARTHSFWQPRAVSVETLKEIYDLARMAPTSANTSPARFVFLTTASAKERLLPAMAPLNVDKTRNAPVVAIIAQDREFYEQLPTLFPQADARSWFVGNQALIDVTAFRNSSLQGAYLMLAARAVGLDCGPMSGFDPDKVNAEFFPDGKWSVNFICNLGYGDASKLFPRNPRLDFEQACRVL